MIKVIVNRGFTFGIESGMIKGVDRSPAYGISLGSQEQKKPEILSLEQIKELLCQARDHSHPWYPVWARAQAAGIADKIRAFYSAKVWQNNAEKSLQSINMRTITDRRRREWMKSKSSETSLE